MNDWRQLDKAGRIEVIKSVWQPGMSASMIAESIGISSRGSIIGLYDRNRIALADHPIRGKSENQYALASVARTRKAHKRPAIIIVQEPILSDAPEPKWLSMANLEPRQCRWPVTPDDVAPADHRFCGHETAPGKSYCDHHDARKWGAGTRAENMAFKTARKVEGVNG